MGQRSFSKTFLGNDALARPSTVITPDDASPDCVLVTGNAFRKFGG
jgi:hypothetical protein